MDVESFSFSLTAPPLRLGDASHGVSGGVEDPLALVQLLAVLALPPLPGLE